MKTKKPFTEKQQIKIKSKAYRLLKSMGFIEQQGGYLSIDIGGKTLSVGRDILSHFSGDISHSWNWYIGEIEVKPHFGVSGNMSGSGMWWSAEDVIKTTLERIDNIGFCRGNKLSEDHWNEKKEEIKKILG